MNTTIKQKKGKCIDCSDESPEKNLIAKRCHFHYWEHRRKLKNPKTEWKTEKRKEMNTFLSKPRKPIPKVSAKQLENLKKYRKIRDEFMANKTCEAKLNGCTGKATDLHHAKGKIGDLLTDKRYFKALCRNCHSYIEVHPDFAKENGFSFNRL